MAKIQRFEDIEAWQTARALTRAVYEMTSEGDFARDYGLKDQIRRASVSVMSNIAEGFESRSDRLFADFLGRARGSAGEVRCQAYIAGDVGYWSAGQVQKVLDLAQSASRQVSGFMWYLQRHPSHTLRESPIPYNAPSDLSDLTTCPT